MKQSIKTAILATSMSLAMSLSFGTASHAANSWGLDYEEEREFKAKVVDLACELSGNCPANCGDGQRQLGLLTPEGTLIPVVKGGTLFAGAVDELLSYCQQQVHVDGLYIKNPAMHMYFVQRIKSRATGKWLRANKWRKNWAQRNPDATKGQWFRNDPLIKELIARKGVLGIPGLKVEE